jgi:hypothetical protein
MIGKVLVFFGEEKPIDIDEALADLIELPSSWWAYSPYESRWDRSSSSY